MIDHRSRLDLFNAAKNAHPDLSPFEAAHAFADTLRAEDRAEDAALLESLVDLTPQPDDSERVHELAAEIEALNESIRQKRAARYRLQTAKGMGELKVTSLKSKLSRQKATAKHRRSTPRQGGEAHRRGERGSRPHRSRTERSPKALPYPRQKQNMVESLDLIPRSAMPRRPDYAPGSTALRHLRGVPSFRSYTFSPCHAGKRGCLRLSV